MELQILKDFFMWCTIINLVFFTFTAVLCIFCRGFILRVHGKMFDLNKTTINAMLYGFMAFYKIVFIVFVLVPWIALTLMC